MQPYCKVLPTFLLWRLKEEKHHTVCNDLQINKWHFSFLVDPFLTFIADIWSVYWRDDICWWWRKAEKPSELLLRDSYDSLSSHLSSSLSPSQRHVGRSFGSRSNLCRKTVILADRTGSIVWSVWSFYLHALNRITKPKSIKTIPSF